MSRSFGAQSISIITILVFCAILLCANDGAILSIGTLPSVGSKNVRAGEFFAYSDDLGSLEHDILFHNLNGIISKTRNSDVLFVGNSRMQMGWDHNLLRKIANSAGFKIFNLSCGNSEGITFFAELIKKHDIRDKIVVVNIDSGTPIISGPASKAMNTPWLPSLESVLNKTSYFHSKALAESFLSERIISDIDHYGYYVRIRATILRNFTDGFWIYRHWGVLDGKGKPCSDEKRGFPDEDALPKIANFMQIMRDQNNYVILTQVPSTDSSPQDVHTVANTIGGTPLLYTREYTKMWTYDGSHLNTESATQFTEEILPRIVAMAREHLPRREPAPIRGPQ